MANEIKWGELSLLGSGVAQTKTDDVLFKDLLDEALNSDAFIFIPMTIDPNDDHTFSVNTSVQMHDRLNLGDKDAELEAVYLSALGGLLGSCFNRLDARSVIDYLGSLLQRFIDMEKAQKNKH